MKIQHYTYTRDYYYLTRFHILNGNKVDQRYITDIIRQVIPIDQSLPSFVTIGNDE